MPVFCSQCRRCTTAARRANSTSMSVLFRAATCFSRCWPSINQSVQRPNSNAARRWTLDATYKFERDAQVNFLLKRMLDACGCLSELRHPHKRPTTAIRPWACSLQGAELLVGSPCPGGVAPNQTWHPHKRPTPAITCTSWEPRHRPWADHATKCNLDVGKCAGSLQGPELSVGASCPPTSVEEVSCCSHKFHPIPSPHVQSSTLLWHHVLPRA